MKRARGVIAWSPEYARLTVYQLAGAGDELPDGLTLVARTAPPMGKIFPLLKVDKRHVLQEWSPSADLRFRADIRRIGEKYGISESKQHLRRDPPVGDNPCVKTKRAWPACTGHATQSMCQ